MSRRSHHPGRRHGRSHVEPRPARPASPGEPGLSPTARPARPGGRPAALTPPASAVDEAPPAAGESRAAPGDGGARERARLVPAPVTATVDASAGTLAGRPDAPARPFGASPPAEAERGTAPSGAPSIRIEGNPGDPDRGACTAPQLRRFIKSRAYVPMHELRRRFAINGGEDDVTPVDIAAGTRVFVGLPNREGRLLGELLRAGDIGYELSLDPVSPIVVGVFPMRPVPRS